MIMKFAPLAVGDVIRLRKPHPCGSYDWAILRVGADIGLKCVKCSRRIMLPRTEVERRLKQIISHTENTQEPDEEI